jgi:hypothetical protein
MKTTFATIYTPLAGGGKQNLKFSMGLFKGEESVSHSMSLIHANLFESMSSCQGEASGQD